MALTERHTVREEHVVHVEVIPPLDWQMTPCERAGRKEGIRNLAFRGLTFLPPDVAVRLLGDPWSIADAYQLLSPLLAGRAPPYKEAMG